MHPSLQEVDLEVEDFAIDIYRHLTRLDTDPEIPSNTEITRRSRIEDDEVHISYTIKDTISLDPDSLPYHFFRQLARNFPLGESKAFRLEHAVMKELAQLGISSYVYDPETDHETDPGRIFLTLDRRKIPLPLKQAEAKRILERHREKEIRCAVLPPEYYKSLVSAFYGYRLRGRPISRISGRQIYNLAQYILKRAREICANS